MSSFKRVPNVKKGSASTYCNNTVTKCWIKISDGNRDRSEKEELDRQGSFEVECDIGRGRNEGEHNGQW